MRRGLVIQATSPNASEVTGISRITQKMKEDGLRREGKGKNGRIVLGVLGGGNLNDRGRERGIRKEREGDKEIGIN